MKKYKTTGGSFILPFFFILLALLLGVGIYFSIRVDVVKDASYRKRVIPFLLIILDDGKPIATEALFLHSGKNRLAIIDIPKEAGNTLKALMRSARYTALYNENNKQLYYDVIERLLGIRFLFYMEMSVGEFGSLVDILGGVDIFVPHTIEMEERGQHYSIPGGSVILDGDKAMEYLLCPITPVTEKALVRRNIRLVRGVMEGLGAIAAHRSDFAKEITRIIDISSGRESLSSLIDELSRVNIRETVIQEYLGVDRTVGNEVIIFPMYNGNIIIERVQWIIKSLNAEETPTPRRSITVEVLNGTPRRRLAQNTAAILDNYHGYNVVYFGNADRDDYEHTVILDLTGDPEAVADVAENIRCKRTDTHIGGDNLNDVKVRIILGRDFNGQYVEE